MAKQKNQKPDTVAKPIKVRRKKRPNQYARELSRMNRTDRLWSRFFHNFDRRVRNQEK